jgi:(R,R)-butanediol dehydrogenase / meso-butanediol dehydrogenase / diacetyl reductase
LKAAVYYGKRDVRIETVPEPGRPGSGELVLAVGCAGICGTDVAEYMHGPRMIPLQKRHRVSGHCGPLILGHEFVGQIVAIGPDVQGLRVGQRVVPGAGMSCGQCHWCLSGQSHLCARYFVYGLHADGGLATFVRVPARICAAVPDNCPDESAAMAQPLAIALHALRRSDVRKGERMALIGVGGIGSFILAASHAAGITSIIALDIDEQRLERAAQLGASSLIQVRREDPLAAIDRLRQFDGADVVIEASGAACAPALALAAVRRGGRVLLVGLQGQPTTLDLHELVLQEVDLLSSNGHVCAIDLPQALVMLGESDLASCVLERIIPLEQLVPEGLQALAEGRVHGKILVRPESGLAPGEGRPRALAQREIPR